MTTQPVSVLRIIDANFNRATEGMRVVEDYLRFVLDDGHLCGLCKRLRHQLVDVLSIVPELDRLRARQTRLDVGTHITMPSEGRRETVRSVVIASCRRAEQALRCLEEYVKLLSPAAASQCESLRYEMYTLAQAVEGTARARDRLAATQLYVLVDGRSSMEEFDVLLERLIRAEVHAIQLRDKDLCDGELIQRARLLTERASGAGVLSVVNDRPDIAALSRADGVHVGQDELNVKDVRSIVGTHCLIGVSTHSVQQAREAVLDGADYIGCGPVFPSPTKSFNAFVGPPFLRDVAREISLPSFAIGGINEANVGEVVEAGFRRIAVSAAVCGADNPGQVVQSLLASLSGG